MPNMYFVTYGAIDSEYGNQLWHSFILLSQLEEGKRIEVVDNYGYYAAPASDRTSTFGKFKIDMKADVDVWGNHGFLKHEEFRFLDPGKGTHGTTFQLTEAQFTLLQAKCKKIVFDQEQAIKEVVDELGLKVTSKQKVRHYAHEEHAKLIYDVEKTKAKQENRPSRLRPFDYSYSCKTGVISILEEILRKEQIDRLTVSGHNRIIPRFSGKLEDIYLHSEGPLSKHKKAAGGIVYFCDGADPEVKLYWTLPPQEIETLDKSTKDLLTVSRKYCDDAKNLIGKLQRLEWLFINAEVPTKYQKYKTTLIHSIQACYQSFSVINAPKEKKDIEQWKKSVASFFSLPVDEDEKALHDKIKRGQNLIDNLYRSISYGFEIETDCSSESPAMFESPIEDTHFHTEEALASYLSLTDKISLCKIIGRSYDGLETEDELCEEYQFSLSS